MFRRLLPNLLTLGNLAAGSWAIALSYKQAWDLFAGAILIAMLCDWLDGFVARWLKAESPLGKELDSLADLVSFGMAPAFGLYNYLKEPLPTLPYGNEARFWMVMAPFLLPLLAAWRLARFNVEAPSSMRFFEGLPTPAHGIFWAAWLLTHPTGIWFHPVVWIGQVLLLGMLMVSRWPFLSLKSRKNLTGIGILLLLSLGLLFLPPSFWPLGVIGLYATISRLLLHK